MGDALDKAVDAILGSGIATSVTLNVSTPDATLTRSWGVRHDGEPASIDDLAPLYCGTKPLLALALFKLHEQGRLSLDEPIGPHLDWLGDHWFSTLTARNLLSHTRAIKGIPLVYSLLKRPEGRAQLLMDLSTEPNETRCYSDYAGWFLVAHLVERITGEDHRDHVLAEVVTPYGIAERDLNIGIAQELFDQWRDDIALNLYRRGDTGLYPLAAEGARIWACEWNPPMASYGNVRGLTQLYRGILGDLAGARRVVGPELLAEATTPGEPYEDERLARTVSFGTGFMTNLPLHEMGGAISPRSFGHAGVGGGSAGFADPDRQLAGGIVINRIFDESPVLLNLRGEVMTAAYEELGLPTAPADAA